MPDSLSPILSDAERRATADRLWKLVEMIDAQKSPGELREAVVFTARQIEPFAARYQENNHGR